MCKNIACGDTIRAMKHSQIMTSKRDKGPNKMAGQWVADMEKQQQKALATEITSVSYRKL